MYNIITADNAKLGLTETKLAIIPGAGNLVVIFPCLKSPNSYIENMKYSNVYNSERLEKSLDFIIISPDAVWGYIGFGLVAPRPPPQVTYERDNSKTNVQDFMKLCRSLDISITIHFSSWNHCNKNPWGYKSQRYKDKWYRD